MIFSAIVSHPDIPYLINKVGQFLNNYKNLHSEAVKRIVTNLVNTVDFGMEIEQKNAKSSYQVFQMRITELTLRHVGQRSVILFVLLMGSSDGHLNDKRLYP